MRLSRQQHRTYKIVYKALNRKEITKIQAQYWQQ